MSELERKERILLVEDSYFTAMFISGFLHDNNYETIVTSKGEDAVSKIKAGLVIDLILMDIVLDGDMDGIETADQILDIIDVPIVFITSNASKDIAEKIKQVKAYGFMQKGIKKEAMMSAIEIALRLHEINTHVKRQEAMLSKIVNITQNAVVVFDEHMSVTFCNPSMVKLLGYTKEEIAGVRLTELIMTNEKLREHYEQFQLIGGSEFLEKPEELKIKCKDNTEKVIEISFSAFYFMEKWHGLGFIQDISERKKEQDKIEKNRKDYLEMIENSPVGILKCDTKGNLTYVNKKVIEILGSPSIEETKKINVFTFHLLEEYGLSDILRECIQSPNTNAREFHYITKWGKNVWIRAYARLLKEKDGISEIQIVMDEITEKKEMEEKLHYLSITDELTGAYNRRYMKERIEEEIRRGENTEIRFTIIMLDIDNFKNVNDNHGHGAGDSVLELFTQGIKKEIRKADILARWGGEEFMVLLYNTSIQNTANLAELMRIRLSQIEILNVGSVTASFGIAQYHVGDTIDTLVKRADAMMYQAKKEGKNCVRYLKG
ncbi:MAG: diguanylate cyclase [Lachnospiraceae bacterium]|nr:diguanylate cyclase [Lachnospiraceae bacterium]